MARKPTQSLKDLMDREVEKPVLEALYVQEGVATDQLRRVPEVLARITATFNRVTGRDFDQGTLLRYMINRRKKTDWPTLGSKARKFASVGDKLTPAQLESLKQIYLRLDITSDEFLYRPSLMTQLSRLFVAAIGMHIKGSILVAVIVTKRKRGEWPTIRETQAGEFSDIDIVAQRFGTNG